MAEENEKLKWYEDKVDEIIMGVIMGAISIISIIVLKTDSVPIVMAAFGAYGIYLNGKQKTNGG